jgi:fatty-acyl-CoA synthase
VGQIKSTLDAVLDDDGRADLRTTVGQPSVCVEARIARAGSTEALPWDGETSGELQVRGPWIAAAYYDDPRSPESFTEDGWLKTGDVAVIDEHGYIRLVDRTKDVIKSGGEWISSVELENELMGHPAVAEAAVIGIPHPKWQERPLACVVLAEGAEVTKEDLLAHLEGKVASWWMPDDLVVVDEIPKTSVGKFSKKDLRSRFEDYELPTA